jgi:hypothetical protein
MKAAAKLVLVLLCTGSFSAAFGAERKEACSTTAPSLEELENHRYTIERIEIERIPIFDTRKPEEDHWLFRGANRLHIMTRESTIRARLLFREGDAFSRSKIAETERLLRSERFLRDAKISITKVCGHRLALKVTTQDVWTLIPSINFGRSGGVNTLSFNISENNLLGTGRSLRIARFSNAERTGTAFGYEDNNLSRYRAHLAVDYENNDDGDKREILFERPFYSLDTRWSAGFHSLTFDREKPIYFRGEEALRFRKQTRFLSLYGGRSEGLVAGETSRFRAGLTLEEDTFDLIPGDPLSTNRPDDRKWVYPWISYEQIEDRFIVRENLDQINRSEDFNVGQQFRASLGIASSSLGSLRDGLIVSANYTRSLTENPTRLWLMDAGVRGVWSEQGIENLVYSGSTRFYWQHGSSRGFFLRLSGDVGKNLYLDSPLTLGGDNGLRGYPLKYQLGDRRWLLTIEERFYTHWQLWQLFDVGAAVFADAGRAWFANGDNGTIDDGVLADVGFGLRFSSFRAGHNKVIHVDVAFPTGSEGDIAGTQFLVKVKSSF